MLYLMSARCIEAFTCIEYDVNQAWKLCFIHCWPNFEAWRLRMCIVLRWKPVLELWSVTCRTGSHIVTCHKRQINVLFLLSPS